MPTLCLLSEWQLSVPDVHLKHQRTRFWAAYPMGIEGWARPNGSLSFMKAPYLYHLDSPSYIDLPNLTGYFPRHLQKQLC